jgi:hypothetical protein
MKTKETVIINGREYEVKDTTASDILGMALAVFGLSFLMVATFGTVALSILGVL